MNYHSWNAADTDLMWDIWINKILIKLLYMKKLKFGRELLFLIIEGNLMPKKPIRGTQERKHFGWRRTDSENGERISWWRNPIDQPVFRSCLGEHRCRREMAKTATQSGTHALSSRGSSPPSPPSPSDSYSVAARVSLQCSLFGCWEKVEERKICVLFIYLFSVYLLRAVVLG